MSQMTTDMSCCRGASYLFLDFQILNTSSTIYNTCRAGIAYSTGVLFRSYWSRIAKVLVFCVIFQDQQFILFFFSWHCIEFPSLIAASYQYFGIFTNFIYILITQQTYTPTSTITTIPKTGTTTTVIIKKTSSVK